MRLLCASRRRLFRETLSVVALAAVITLVAHLTFVSGGLLNRSHLPSDESQLLRGRSISDTVNRCLPP